MTELKEVLRTIHAGDEVLPGPGKDIPDDEEDEDMAADGLADHYRWPDPRAVAKESAEDDIPDKELEDAEQEEAEKQRAQQKLLAKLFASGSPPFAKATNPSQVQVAQTATRSPDPVSMLPELQALSLGLSLHKRTITCDQNAKVDDALKPIVMSPAVSGEGEISFRIGERWLGRNEFFCVSDQQLDMIRSGVQHCREHSAWAYISTPGAFSVGGDSWWKERQALNGSIITIRLVAAGAKGRLLQFAVDGQPIPTASCAVPMRSLYAPAGQQLRFGVLFAGDCRGDNLDVVGSHGLSPVARKGPEAQRHSNDFLSQGRSFATTNAGTRGTTKSLLSWVT